MDKARVLIVDDEQAARVGLSEIISAWGYETQSASDGVEALEIAKDFQPGAVITDVFMPRLDGFGLLTRLRDEYPETAIILLTGQGSVEDAVRERFSTALINPALAEAALPSKKSTHIRDRVLSNRSATKSCLPPRPRGSTPELPGYPNPPGNALP